MKKTPKPSSSTSAKKPAKPASAPARKPAPARKAEPPRKKKPVPAAASKSSSKVSVKLSGLWYSPSAARKARKAAAEKKASAKPEEASAKPEAKKDATKKAPSPKSPAKTPVKTISPTSKKAAPAPAKKPEQKKAASAPAKKPEQKKAASAPAKKPEQKKAASAPAKKPEQKKAASAPAKKPEQKKAASAQSPKDAKESSQKQIEAIPASVPEPESPEPPVPPAEPAVADLPTPVSHTAAPPVSTLPPEIVPLVPSVDEDDLFGDAPAPADSDSGEFTKKELDELRADLLAQRARLSGKAVTLQDQSLRRYDEVNPEEDGTDAAMRITELGKAALAEASVNDIDAALRAIDDGTFGVCQNCGSRIGKARLRAQPFAKYCVPCQSEMEADAALRRAPTTSAADYY